ncbi:MAG: D-amino acid dehydrogenase [Burkholderiaceae bacterium]|nr:D-amino acid dehydrogenase [Rhodoferax sp.]MCP5287407.1 D-amino acid dehydrogenase [Burkholderiaceae bacterium]
MRIAIIGAGIIGVTTAYELAADGHSVSVFERGSAVADGTSFANAGVIAPGYVTPWAAPGMAWKVLRQMAGRHAAVRVAPSSLWRDAPWLWRWWRACRPAVYGGNRTHMHRLARYSQERVASLTQRLQLDYERGQGYMVLLRGERELTAARGSLKLLAELGVSFELLDAARARQQEPGLNPDMPLRAAIHLPQDGVGNCRQFAHLLKAEAQKLGAQFHFQQTVRRLQPGATVTLDLADGPQTFDAAVVCAGVDAGALLTPLGLRLPLLPVWGYSLTAPLRELEHAPDLGPRSALMDERFKVAISRLGRRVRVAGSAELGGQAGRFHPGAMATLHKVLDDWFPGAAQLAQAQRWKGARPMLPDGPPVIGPSGRDGLWLNLGHGSSGWALSAGSARALADQLGGRKPAIALDGLGVDRLA